MSMYQISKNNDGTFYGIDMSEEADVGVRR